MHEVSKAHGEAYIIQLAENGPYRKHKELSLRVETEQNAPKTKIKLANNGVNSYLITLRQVFSVLAEDATVDPNPFTSIPKLQDDCVHREAFTPEELELIGEHADGFLFPIFLLGVNTGLREGDICTLLWSEIDLQRGWITRRASKTGKVVRIPILPSLHTYLSGLEKKSEYVLPDQAATYLERRQTISKMAKTFLHKLNITTRKRLSGRDRASSVKDIHSLRHTWAYMAAIHDVPFPVVQAVLGHGSPHMSKIYMDHATDKVKKETLSRLPDYLCGGSTETPKHKLTELIESLTPDNLEEKKAELLSVLQLF